MLFHFPFNVDDKAFTIKGILSNLIKGTDISRTACLCLKYGKQNVYSIFRIKQQLNCLSVKVNAIIWRLFTFLAPKECPSVVTHAYNLCTKEAKGRRILSSKPARDRVIRSCLKQTNYLRAQAYRNAYTILTTCPKIYLSSLQASS